MQNIATIAPSFMLIIIIAATFARQNRAIRTFLATNTLTPQNAKPLTELNLTRSPAIRFLTRHNIIKQAPTGDLFLDPTALAQFQTKRRNIAATAVTAAVAITATIWLITTASN